MYLFGSKCLIKYFTGCIIIYILEETLYKGRVLVWNVSVVHLHSLWVTVGELLSVCTLRLNCRWSIHTCLCILACQQGQLHAALSLTQHPVFTTPPYHRESLDSRAATDQSVIKTRNIICLNASVLNLLQLMLASQLLVSVFSSTIHGPQVQHYISHNARRFSQSPCDYLWLLKPSQIV